MTILNYEIIGFCDIRFIDSFLGPNGVKDCILFLFSRVTVPWCSYLLLKTTRF